MFWRRVNKITASEAKLLMARAEVTVVDVRRPTDYAKSRIKGALNADRKTVHEKLSTANRSTPVICYCYSGFSSKTACRNLAKAGFERVLNLKGGYAAWQRMQRKLK